MEEARSQLYHLPSDPLQQKNVISHNTVGARDIQQYLVIFMRETNLPEPRLELRT
ncbi:hypothetical protein ACFLX9_00160 [Chloroflexota bacterium]